MKRTHKEIMKAILQSLRGNKFYAYGYLERKVNTNWRTIRDHCENLEFFEVVEISKDNKIKITKKGLEFLKKLK